MSLLRLIKRLTTWAAENRDARGPFFHTFVFCVINLFRNLLFLQPLITDFTVTQNII